MKANRTIEAAFTPAPLAHDEPEDCRQAVGRGSRRHPDDDAGQQTEGAALQALAVD